MIIKRSSIIPAVIDAELENFGNISVTVPSDYIGMHFHRWPTANPSGIGSGDNFDPITKVSQPPGDLSYGSFRSHDNSSWPVGIVWRSIHTSRYTFDWSGLDTVIAAHEARGVSILYTIFSTPLWAATPAGQTHSSSYGAGACDKPNVIAYLEEFIIALVTRYGTRIQYIEIWNEPSFDQNWTGFFWGSAIDLVAMGNAIYTKAKSINPSVIILSPGFSGNGSIAPFLSAQDPVSGKYGYQVCDHIAIHPYGHTFFGLLPFTSDIYKYGGQSILSVRDILNSNNSSSKSIYITEHGSLDGNATHMNIINNILSAEQRRIFLHRTLLICAILEVKMFALYSYDGIYSGNLVSDIYGFRKALYEISNNICGKTITYAKIYTNNKIEYIANGIKYKV